MSAYQKQIKVLVAVGLVLIATVFVYIAMQPLQEQKSFANGISHEAVSLEEEADDESETAAGTKAPIEPINLNTATLAQLESLPGIGETRAESIIAYREKHGNFGSIEEVMKVYGIGEKTYEQIKDYICV